MHHVQAIVSLGLFGWLSYAVLTDSFPGGDGGSSKTRALKGMIDNATAQFGVAETAAALFLTGVALAFLFYRVSGRRG